MDIRLIPCSVSFTGLDLQLVPGSHAENKCREESFPTLYWIWCCMMNKGDSPFFIFTYVTVHCIIFSIFITNCLWKAKHISHKKKVYCLSPLASVHIFPEWSPIFHWKRRDILIDQFVQKHLICDKWMLRHETHSPVVSLIVSLLKLGYEFFKVKHNSRRNYWLTN